jgi:acyl-coenzyme A thioesterase PaaI-like protein
MELGPRGMRRLLNLYPPYFFTRTRVKSISADWRESVVQLKKSLLNRNYVGTTFGGSIFAASDPFFMLMLIGIFGIRDYIIWDKAATIEYKRPARSTLNFRFLITDEDIAAIEKDLAEHGKSEPVLHVDAVDREGHVCATVSKTLYIRKKDSRPEA